MNELALFAGVGGGILGTHLLGARVVCAVEAEPYCREVLLRRQLNGLLPLFPIWDRIETFDGKPWNGVVDLVTAGFPCQPFSVSGRREGDKSGKNLWPETLRVIREVGPRLIFLENSPHLLAFDYFGEILGQLVESGFDLAWDCLPASALGAPHQRDRVWILASNPNVPGEELFVQPKERQGPEDPPEPLPHGHEERVADSENKGLEGRRRNQKQPESIPYGWWASEPRVGGILDGVSKELDIP